MTDGDRALDYGAASRELAAIGIARQDGSPYSDRQVRRMAEDHKLPFFKTPDRRRLIMRSALLATVENWQRNATREIANAKAEAERFRRPKSRT